MNKVKFICLLVIVLTAPFKSKSQSQNTTQRFERIGKEKGLTHTSINYIIQDRNGYMWFATYGGIYRYDGYNLKNYAQDPKNKNGLSSNIIEYLFEDNDGKIWIVNSNLCGVDMFDPVYDKITNFSNNPNDTNSIFSDRVFHVIQDRKERIWLLNEFSLDLLNYKDKTYSFKHFKIPSKLSTTSHIVEYNEDTLIIISDRKSYLFNIDNQEFNIINDTIFRLFFYNFYDVDHKGNFLTYHNNDIVKLKYNDKLSKFDIVKKFGMNLPCNFRNSIRQDKDSNIWVANDSKGLFKYNPKSKELIHFAHDATNNQSISDNKTKSLYLDNTDILWIATSNQGVCSYDLNRNKVFHYNVQPNSRNSLSGNLISSIHSKKDNEIWVGIQDTGGVNRLIFDQKDNMHVIHYQKEQNNPNSIPHSEVFSLFQRQSGDVWISGSYEYITRIIPENPFSGNKPKFENHKINAWSFSLFEDSEGVLWGGSWGSGLWRYNDEKKDFTYYLNDESDKNSIVEDVIWSIYEDKNKNIWIGGKSKGISILKAEMKYLDNPEFINFRYQENDPYSIIDENINAFLQDSRGTMWIATFGGLVMVMKENDSIPEITNSKSLKFKAFTINDGLPSNEIMGIVEDRKGNLWLSTSNGISFFNLTDSTFTNYYENDGFQGNEYLHNAYFINSNGRIFFGGKNGVNAFYPEDVKPNPYIPRMAFTNIKIFNSPVKINHIINNQVILTKSLNETSEIELSHKNNFITIEFSALHFVQPEKNKYAFYLDGYEKDWNHLENTHSATYTNLDPGKYTFRAKASNNNGIWNEEGISLDIIVKPAFWNTPWFRFFYISLGISFIILIYYLRTKQIKIINKNLEKAVTERTIELNKKNEQLLSKAIELNETNTILEERQQKIEEQTEELEVANEQLLDSNTQLSELNSMKNKFFSIIGHDLKNPINVIMGFSQILDTRYNNLEEDRRKMIIKQLYKASTHTYQLLENLLEWARSQSGRMEYSPRVISLGNTIQENINLLKDQADKKNIKINIINNLQDDIVFCDERMISTVIRNLISNAIKFTNPGGLVEIKHFLSKDNNQLITCIEDNGIGISGPKLLNMFNLENKYATQGTDGEVGTGLGLILCKEFIEKNKGKIWVESEVDVGSKFYFSLQMATHML